MTATGNVIVLGRSKLTIWAVQVMSLAWSAKFLNAERHASCAGTLTEVMTTVHFRPLDSTQTPYTPLYRLCASSPMPLKSTLVMESDIP
jgi:hypothetical protein